MRARVRRRTGQGGVTLAELLIALAVMGAVFYSISLIYFSTYHVYIDRVWQLPPYDDATAAIKRMQQEMREAMLVPDHSADVLVAIQPLKDSSFDNVLVQQPDGTLTLQFGDMVAFYLSDETGALDATGNVLWKAVKAPADASFTPRVIIARNIHPELNPEDPNNPGLPRPMFKYYPDDNYVWGVEVWMTSTNTVHHEELTQTAHSQIYMRNLQ
jgi:hypothetical protein